jgi:hypothetical protein
MLKNAKNAKKSSKTAKNSGAFKPSIHAGLRGVYRYFYFFLPISCEKKINKIKKSQNKTTKQRK